MICYDFSGAHGVIQNGRWDLKKSHGTSNVDIYVYEVRESLLKLLK